MKRLVNIFAALILISLVLFIGPTVPSSGFNAMNFTAPTLNHSLSFVPMAVGEHAQMAFRWLGMTVAYGELTLTERVQHRGRDAWHVVLNVKTTKFLDFLFPVRDEYHSYIDVENLESIRFEKIVQEGDYRADEVVEYDREKKLGHYFSRLNKSEKTFSTDSVILDPISAVYWFRSRIPLEVGKTIDVPINYEESNWRVRVPMVRQEEIQLEENDSVSAIKMTPFITNLDEHMHEWEKEHQEMLSGSKITVWVEKSGNRIPLQVSVKVPLVGSVKINVTEYNCPS